MRKLELRLEELQVESFETELPPRERGKVHGEQVTRLCPSDNCTGVDGGTCADSCERTCGACSNECYLTGTEMSRMVIDGQCS